MRNRTELQVSKARGPSTGRNKTPRPEQSHQAQAPALTHKGAAPAVDATAGGRFRDLIEAAPVAAFVKDHEGRYVYANPYLLTALGKWMGSDWYGKSDADIWPPEAALMIRSHDEAVLRGESQAFSWVVPLKGGPHTVLLMEFPLPTADGLIGVAGIGVDITEHSKAEGERDRLAAGIEQVAESIIITDRDAKIVYVNPAFEQVTGYAHDEVIGRNPSLLKSGLQPPAFYEAMWAALTRGSPWVGDIVNRHKDGTLFTEEAVISPVRDSTGAIASYVAVQRDVTHERELVDRSTQLARQHALVAETIRSLRAGDTPEATAQAICSQVVSFPGIAAARFSLFELDGRAHSIGLVVLGQPGPPLRRLPLEHSRQLRQRAAEGPWIESWLARPPSMYNEFLKGLGIHAVAHAPVRHDGQLIGLLMGYANESVEDVAVTEVLPALVEFADLAGALIGRDVAERTEAGRGREYIAGIIARQAFGPVFQPIVDLGSRTIVGYEALTRFADGTHPEVVFAEATAVGLGIELETATLQAALTAAEALPKSVWLNLNASAELVLEGEPLRTILAGRRRRLVLEVTEHTVITDYPAFRAAVASLRAKVKLAVDDAGAGFASLRHILELDPAFVKLDRWLVAGLESDGARRAMIVGLLHFAGVTGCRLIAEGIETDNELAALRALGIRLGQGFLLGRPLPVDHVGRHVASDG